MSTEYVKIYVLPFFIFKLRVRVPLEVICRNTSSDGYFMFDYTFCNFIY